MRTALGVGAAALTYGRTRLFSHGRGFACVNDGAAVASQLAPYLADLESSALPKRSR